MPLDGEREDGSDLDTDDAGCAIADQCHVGYSLGREAVLGLREGESIKMTRDPQLSEQTLPQNTGSSSTSLFMGPANVGRGSAVGDVGIDVWLCRICQEVNAMDDLCCVTCRKNRDGRDHMMKL